MPTGDNNNHSGRAVGTNVMADDGVGRRAIVVGQRELISLRAEKPSRDS
jgi:hypothetical protein